MSTREKFLELVRAGVVMRSAHGGNMSHRLGVRVLARALCLPEWAPHPSDLAATGLAPEAALAKAAIDFIEWCWGDEMMPAWMERVAAHKARGQAAQEGKKDGA